MNMTLEMKEEFIKKKMNGKNYNIRLHTRRLENSSTLIIGSSLLRHIKNDQFDTISISGARIETVFEYLKTMDVEKYIKIGILAGGNNLRSWNGEEGDSPLKVVLSFCMNSLYLLIDLNAEK